MDAWRAAARAAGAIAGLPRRDWPSLAAALARQGLLTNDDAARIALAWWFRRLIGNTDMYLGNLSLHPGGERFTLAPPTRCCQCATRRRLPALTPMTPELPLPAESTAWRRAAATALYFWERAAQDTRASEAFFWLATADLKRLREAASPVG